MKDRAGDYATLETSGPGPPLTRLAVHARISKIARKKIASSFIPREKQLPFMNWRARDMKDERSKALKEAAAEIRSYPIRHKPLDIDEVYDKLADYLLAMADE